MPDMWFVGAEELDARLAEFSSEIRLQERVFAILADGLVEPEFVRSAPAWCGFRYSRPGPKHFCLLKAARCVSALNAILVLVRAGFSQEIAVLLRTIIENSTHLEYVLAGYSAQELQEPQRKYVAAYFADNERDAYDDFSKSQESRSSVRSKPRVRQETVHKTLGARLDDVIPKMELPEKYQDVAAAELMSDSYMAYSNYVHSRYPEVMELFGGEPGHFHLRGMRGTPKDFENLEIVGTFIVTVSNALRYMVLGFGMQEKLEKHPELLNWYHFRGQRAS